MLVNGLLMVITDETTKIFIAPVLQHIDDRSNDLVNDVYDDDDDYFNAKDDD